MSDRRRPGEPAVGPPPRPSELPRPGELLRRHGLRPKRSWGQNFLVDESVFRTILTCLEARPDDWVLEVGAGLGTLTARLTACCARVVALERDRDLAAVLRAELGGRDEIEIVEGNALTFDYDALARRAPSPLRVVGNLPYQIASPILFRLLAQRQRIGRILIMLQREMAERLAAPPGSRVYGGLSVMGQALAEVRLCARVPAGAFLPPPRVESALVCLDPRPQPLGGSGHGGRGLASRVRGGSDLAGKDDGSDGSPDQGSGSRTAVAVDEAWLSRTVRTAFSGRRKRLRNALAPLLPRPLLLAALAEAEIDADERPERIDPAGFVRLSQATQRLAQEAGRQGS